MPWYALRHDGQYLRVAWRFLHQTALPVTSLDIQHATLQYNLINAEAEGRRAAAILGMNFTPVAVRLVGHGRDEKITLARPEPGEGE